jgi:hypothetical protein
MTGELTALPDIEASFSLYVSRLCSYRPSKLVLSAQDTQEYQSETAPCLVESRIRAHVRESDQV